MKFNIFLTKLRAKQGFKSASEHFDYFGGEQKLNTSLRNFQLIDSGKRAPSDEFFLRIFELIPNEDKKDAVLSYFESQSEDDKNSSLLKYLDQYLSSSVTSAERGHYESGKHFQMYSADQLHFLSSNERIMKMHHQMLLWERLPPSKLIGQELVAQEMIKLELAERDADGGLKPTKQLYRIPSTDTSSPSAVRAGHKYIGSVVKTYASLEGSSKQRISFCMQLMTPENAQRVIDQMHAFQKWIQTLSSPDTTPSLVPFLYAAFGKKIE